MTPNRAKLDAAIPYILAAPQNSATIQQLCFRPEFGERTFVDELLVTTGAVSYTHLTLPTTAIV